jgi:hypothetical protein
MATYKGIKGFSIQNLSADPSNLIEGEMWYNSTSNVWKVEEATAAGAWATGGNMNTARYKLGCRNTNSSFSFWWLSLDGNTNATEEYDGTSWTAGGTGLNTARRAYSRSRYTNSSISFWWCYHPTQTGATEEYDGSTWTGVN